MCAAVHQTMYDAYESVTIAENLPVSIECTVAYDDRLLLTTREGSLVSYRLQEAGNKFELQLLQINKGFSKKSVTQLQAVPDLGILICLTDNIINVHSLKSDTFTQLSQLQKSKGCTLFACESRRQKMITGGSKLTVMLCVAVRKKLQLYYWKWQRETQTEGFVEHPHDLAVFDTPRTLVWCGPEQLLVGFKSEYCIIKLNGDTAPLFSLAPRQPEPLCIKIKENRFTLLHEKMSVFVDGDGKPTHRTSVTWPDYPTSLSYDFPYLMGCVSSIVYIKTHSPTLDIQRIELSSKASATLVPWKQGCVIAFSTNHLWCLRQLPAQDQIQQVKKFRHYELALLLTELINANEHDRTVCKYHIKNLQAYDLFCQKKFETSMAIFTEIKTDPLHVIGLFPKLLKEEFRMTLQFPWPLPELKDADVEKALYALADFLVQVRVYLLNELETNDQTETRGLVEGTVAVRSKRQLLRIVDTTLLKCYLETNVAPVAALLRLENNFCHLDESEAELLQRHRYADLIILYQHHGQHRKALDLLTIQARNPDSPMRGHERTITYLQGLDRKYIDLIVEYARPVCEAAPDKALEIFTEKGRERLPRDRVLEFLQKNAPTLVIPYLEHIINEWKDEAADRHNLLIHKYRERVNALRKKYLQSLPPGEQPLPAGSEPGELGEIRTKLLKMLNTSQHCTVELLTNHFLADEMYDEAALVLGRLHRHEEALCIYVHVLTNHAKAEEYCIAHYDRQNKRDCDVFLTLLQLYVAPSQGVLNLLKLSPRMANDVSKALEILKRHVTKVDPLRALSILPPSIYVCDMKELLHDLLEQAAKELHSTKFYTSLLISEHRRVKSKQLREQSVSVIIDDHTLCATCDTRIGKSAFARYPDGRLVHYACQKKPTSHFRIYDT